MAKVIFSVGDKCMWNDPCIHDYPKEERKRALERVFTIVDINHENMSNDDEAIISIDDGVTFAEVYANELSIVK